MGRSSRLCLLAGRKQLPEEVFSVEQQDEADGCQREDEGNYDRQSVEVAFHRGGTRQPAAHTATKHLREPTAPAGVQEDEQDENDCREDMDNYQCWKNR